MDNFLIRKDKSQESIYGAEVFSENAYRLPTTKRVALWKRLPDGSSIAFSNKKAFHVTESSITELLGPTGNPAFNKGDENSAVSTEFDKGTLYATSDARPYRIKIYIDGDGNPQLRTAGLPIVASDPTITPSSAGTNNYIYAFVYSYEYMVGTVLFKDFSSPRYIQKTALNNNNSITGIPVLSNGSDYNWDTTHIKVEIYRSVTNGTTLYKVGEVTNGTTTFTDTVADTTLINNEGLYTNGGISNNDLPSPAKYLFECNDTHYELDVLQGTEEKPFRLKQAITNDPDSVPSDYYRDFKSNLIGGAGIGKSALVLTEKQTIRLDGILDELGQGSMMPEVISQTVGGVSHGSIVKTSKGAYFAGTDGFYFTDGYSTPTKLAKRDAFASKIDSTYKRLIATPIQQKRIQGSYDALNNRVYWVTQERDSDNDKIYVYDETQDSFTSISFTGGIHPTSIEIVGDIVYLGDSQGYLFKMHSGAYTWPVIDPTKEPSEWKETTIIYRWKSVQLTGGAGSVNKWFTKINVQGNPETNVNMGILSYTNGESEYKELYPVRVVPGLVWGDPEFTWGDDAFIWDRVATLNQTRRFSSGRMRARQRQVEFTNAYYTIMSSTNQEASFVTVNGTSNTVTLSNPTDYSFGLNNEGYDFVVGDIAYEILSGTEDTLTLSDDLNTLPTGTFPWAIKGKGKGQRAHLLNMTLDFEIMSDAGTQWRGGPTK